ncbi:MAG TPA: tetratricopeptide repeat protein [Candidatus Cloacimonadota bacterium]|nr:tetratricopeptide repeat protein [Candidatus Cloacimonadota bacterium]HPT70782.1 tetratricopeptide repeat protein [Candidatus Cloacimonadota bacterium]
MLKDLFDYFRMKYYHYKGITCMMKGKYQKAYNWMQKVLMIANTTVHQYDMGIILLSLLKYEDAASYLHKVLSAVPDNEMALLAYAQTQLMLRNWDEAMQCYRKLSEQHPTNISYQKYLVMIEDPIQREKNVCAKELVNQAQAEVENRHLIEALEHLKEAESFDPSNPQIPNNIGAILISLERPYEEILSYFEKALSLDPENERIKRNIIFLRHKLKK